jgi:transcriptional regulator with XRE-family HTH domain
MDKHVGARVRMRRQLLGMSQGKLAEALDVTYQQVQKYEKGVNRIGASGLQLLARELQVPPAFFFEDASSNDASAVASAIPSQNPHSFKFVASKEGLHLTRSFRAIRDSSVRKKIIDLVESLATPSGNNR